jgi:transposase
MEKRQPIDLLVGRESAPFENWLKAHPEIEVITRDRAGAYADGARKGAPQAQQVADRWHLLANINQTFERLIHRQQKAIREGVAKIPANEAPITEPVVVKLPILAETASEYKRSRAERERRQTFHEERMARYDRVQDLKRQGHSIIQIRNHLGWSYVEVANFYRADEYPVIRRQHGRSSLGKFDEYLRQRWAAGCQNAGQLYRELCDKGYRGSDLTVRRHVQLWRKQGPGLAPAPQKLSSPTPRSCVWLMLKNDDRLTDEERKLRPAILGASPLIKEGLELVKSFRDAICSRNERILDTWIEKARKCGLPDFENFVKVLLRDEAAVRAAVSSKWSNGQTEGQVNRLKVLKRQMYGRAKFDLLRSRVLNAA